MTRYLRSALTFLLMLSLISLVACGGEDGEGNQEPKEEDKGGDNGELLSECEGNEEGAWSISIPSEYDAQQFNADYDLRMNQFQFVRSSPGAALNDLIRLNIEDQAQNYPVVILLELREIDVDGGTFKVRGGAGLKAGDGGDYRWDDDLELPEFAEGEIHESGAMYARLPLLNFVATIESETEVHKTVIPIRNLELDARLEVAASGGEPTITDGMLRGIVIREEAKDVDVEIPGLSNVKLPRALGEDQLNFDESCDGEADSWQMTAKFSAQEVTLVP